MWDALTPYTGFVTSSNVFSHKHLWFLSVLFAMFLGFALAYRLVSMFPPAGETIARRRSSKRGVLLALLTVGVVTFVLFFLVSRAVGWGYHAFLLANLVHMDFARLSTNAVFFGLGVFAFSRGWFEGDDPPGLVRGWTPVAVALLAVFTALNFLPGLEMTVAVEALLSLLRAFLGLAIFIALTSFAGRRWNRPRPFLDRVSRNSYMIYIVHYPFHGALAVLLMGWGLPPLVNFALVSVVPFAAAYMVSEYGIRRRPAATVLVGVVVNAVMLAVG